MPHGNPIIYTCNGCGNNVTSPVHCGKPMNIEDQNDSTYWICWKGEHEPCCGSEAILPYDPCCEDPELKIGPQIDKNKVLL